MWRQTSAVERGATAFERRPCVTSGPDGSLTKLTVARPSPTCGRLECSKRRCSRREKSRACGIREEHKFRWLTDREGEATTSALAAVFVGAVRVSIGSASKVWVAWMESSDCKSLGVLARKVEAEV